MAKPFLAHKEQVTETLAMISDIHVALSYDPTGREPQIREQKKQELSFTSGIQISEVWAVLQNSISYADVRNRVVLQ